MAVKYFRFGNIKMQTKPQTHTELAAGQFIELFNVYPITAQLGHAQTCVRFKQQMEKLRGSGNSEEHTFYCGSSLFWHIPRPH